MRRIRRCRRLAAADPRRLQPLGHRQRLRHARCRRRHDHRRYPRLRRNRPQLLHRRTLYCRRRLRQPPQRLKIRLFRKKSKGRLKFQTTFFSDKTLQIICTQRRENLSASYQTTFDTLIDFIVFLNFRDLVVLIVIATILIYFLLICHLRSISRLIQLSYPTFLLDY